MIEGIKEIKISDNKVEAAFTLKFYERIDGTLTRSTLTDAAHSFMSGIISEMTKFTEEQQCSAK